MNQIKEWLESENKDFEEGIKLLSKHCKNRALINNLSRKQNEANKNKLAYELSKVSIPDNEPVAEPNEPVVPMVTNQVPDQAPSDQEPNATKDGSLEEVIAEDLEKLVAEMSRLYTERCQLSNTLADITSDEQREQVAAQILGLQDSYNALAEKKAHFEAHGSFPEEKATTEVAPADSSNDKGDLVLSLGRLRSQRSKAKAALEKANPESATYIEKQEKFVKLDQEVKAVEAKIKLIS